MYQNNLFETNFNNGLIMPTFVLCHAYNEPIDILHNVQDFTFDDTENTAYEISFSVYRNVGGKVDPLFDELKDFQLVYIPEWQRYYQIQVGYNDSNDNSIKNVTGIHLCEAELSQLILNNIEINTDADIIRDEYSVAYLYFPDDTSRSLLHRILRDKATNYSIKYVSPSLHKLVRSFSINGQSIDDFLRNTLATEINCVVEYDSIDRSISLYDTLKVCEECGYRGDYNEDVCPKCGSEAIYTEYGQETGIVISTSNIAEEITVETDKDSVKTCFTITGGDDMMDAAIRAVNPNGTNQLYAFNQSILADMPVDLREKIEEYDELHEALQPSYRKIMQHIFDLYDEILYYESEMTAIEKISTTANDELNKLKASQLGNIGVSSLSATTTKSVVDNAVLGLARLHLADGYYVKIDSSTFTYSATGISTWQGTFTVYHYSDEDDSATNESVITIPVTDNYETYVQQKIDKALGNKDAYDIDEHWELYSLDYLKSYESAYQSCLEILMQQGLYATDSHSVINKRLYNEYYNKLIAIQAAMADKEDIINDLNATLAGYEDAQYDITSRLNFKNYLGEDLYSIFCCYRRDDSYNNSNYISDGLTNAELLHRAEELLEAASLELYKACQTKYTITGTIANFLLIPEFKNIRSECCLGNWLHVQTDNGDVYKLRLNGISGNYSSIEQINLTFSNAYKTSEPIDMLKDTIAKASSMASSYQSVAKQAAAGTAANQTLSEMHKQGLSAALYTIMNADNQKIIIDEHGLLCREFDDETQSYLPEQMRIISNLMCFTDDNWKTVKQAIGKIKYTDPETDLLVEKYGVICDTLVATDIYGSKFVGGAIYSEDYWRKNKDRDESEDETGYEVIWDEELEDWVVVELEGAPKVEKGTRISLNDGTFSMADGRLVYDGKTLKVSGDGSGLDISTNNIITKVYTDFTVADGVIAGQVSDLDAKTSSSIKLLTDEINLRVRSDKLISEINMTEETIIMKTGQLVIDSTNFKLDKNGNVTMTGEINAMSGRIGSFALNEYGWLSYGNLLISDTMIHCPGDIIAGGCVSSDVVTGKTGQFEFIQGYGGTTTVLTSSLETVGDISVSDTLTVGSTIVVGDGTDSTIIAQGAISSDIVTTNSIESYAINVIDSSGSYPVVHTGNLNFQLLSCKGYTDIDTRVKTIEDSYVKKSDYNTLKTEHDTLKIKVDTNSENISSLDNLIQATIAATNSTFTNFERAINNLTDSVSELNRKVNNIDECNCSDYSDEISDLWSAIADIKECTCSDSE